MLFHHTRRQVNNNYPLSSLPDVVVSHEEPPPADMLAIQAQLEALIVVADQENNDTEQEDNDVVQEEGAEQEEGSEQEGDDTEQEDDTEHDNSPAKDGDDNEDDDAEVNQIDGAETQEPELE
ncbi:hypothetical protein BGZ89_006085 [Linnemannia elongata]|nr:hypothetical protein BGZ89_006085 [Linnemannia elongata]